MGSAAAGAAGWNKMSVLRFITLVTYKESPYLGNGLGVFISPRLSVGGSSRSRSQACLRFVGVTRDLDINPLLGHGQLVISAVIPMAFSNSVGGLVGDVGVSEAVLGRLSGRSVGKRYSFCLNLGGSGSGNSRIRGDLLSGLLLGRFSTLSIQRRLRLLREGLNLRVWPLLVVGPTTRVWGTYKSSGAARRARSQSGHQTPPSTSTWS